MAVYLPMVAVILFLLLRQLEFMVTYHPTRYVPGPEWTPPANGEDVWIQMGNQRLHGWFVRARSQPAASTVLFCHGNGGNLTNVTLVATALSDHNLDVLIFDYRGYGRSEGKLTDEWGLYSDADAAYDYLIQQRGVRAENLVLYGRSLGTTAAIDLASRRPCKRLIVESGLSSASDMGMVAFPWLPIWFHRLSKNKFESTRKIAGVKCPVLVTHGTADTVIPINQGHKLYEAAREPKRLVIVAEGDHDLLWSGGNEYLQKVVEFIQ